MLRRLSRLLIIALLLAVVAFAVTRLMGGDDDDFDDFDDLDSGFEFEETPVEIDVPASDTTYSAPSSSSAGTATAEAKPAAAPSSTTTVRLTDVGDDTSSADSEANGSDETADSGRLIDINGIGPAYESRLHSIGINSIHDLANADAESVASQLDVIGGASEVSKWVAQAQSQHNHNHDS